MRSVTLVLCVWILGAMFCSCGDVRDWVIEKTDHFQKVELKASDCEERRRDIERSAAASVEKLNVLVSLQACRKALDWNNAGSYHAVLICEENALKAIAD
jgi:hypothetical protein